MSKKNVYVFSSDGHNFPTILLFEDEKQASETIGLWVGQRPEEVRSWLIDLDEDVEPPDTDDSYTLIESLESLVQDMRKTK